MQQSSLWKTDRNYKSPKRGFVVMWLVVVLRNDCAGFSRVMHQAQRIAQDLHL